MFTFVVASSQSPGHNQQAKYQSRLFEFRGKKKPVIKPPPPVDHGSAMVSGLDGDAGVDGAGERGGSGVSHGMTEYIGFVNINLVRGENLVPAGFGQVCAGVGDTRRERKTGMTDMSADADR